MKCVKVRDWTKEEHETWKVLFENLGINRESMAVPEFARGLVELGMTATRIPSQEETNRRLKEKTGWIGVPVEGLEEGASFYTGLARREFPIGNFIRDVRDVNYTPAPDIFHDLYGHIPLFVDKDYAEFCYEYGRLSSECIHNPVQLRIMERFFWFTIEFGLIETKQGRRIFGAGILSSDGESKYSLSDKPEVIPFSVETVGAQEFRIDVFQERLFLLKSRQQLYSSLPELKRYVEQFH